MPRYKLTITGEVEMDEYEGTDIASIDDLVVTIYDEDDSSFSVNYDLENLSVTYEEL